MLQKFFVFRFVIYTDVLDRATGDNVCGAGIRCMCCDVQEAIVMKVGWGWWWKALVLVLYMFFCARGVGAEEGGCDMKTGVRKKVSVVEVCCGGGGGVLDDVMCLRSQRV